MQKASYLAIGKMKMVEREGNGKTQSKMQSEKAASLYQVPVTPEIGERCQVPAPCKSVPHSPVEVALQWPYSGSRVRYGAREPARWAAVAAVGVARQGPLQRFAGYVSPAVQ